jgi:chromosome segregation ATPase
MRNAIILLPVAAALLAGCGINKEQLRQELESERRWTEQQQSQALEQVRADVAAMRGEINDLVTRVRGELSETQRSLAALTKDVEHLRSDVATIKTVAAAMQTTNQTGIERLAKMQKLHDEFLQNVGTLDQKIQVSQEKYREIIRKRIQSLKEQYTYMNTLLRELESGSGDGGGGDPGDSGDNGK